MEQFVRPINIPSPISGQPVVPRIIEKDYGDKVVVEAHWIDPSSGAFIRKGIVEIREKQKLNESWPDRGEMTPDVLKRVRREEERAYRSAGYKPGKRNLAGHNSSVDPGIRYEIPSYEESPKLYDDLNNALGGGWNIEYILQDYFAYASDTDQGDLKSLYDYDFSSPGLQRQIIEPIIDWAKTNW